MTVPKLLLILVLIAVCGVLAYGQVVGSDAGGSVTITTPNGPSVTSSSGGGF